MRRRRKLDEEHDNHERWLVSYADFITLLFAFFVVMYSLSSVNEGKYRVLSDSLVQAFRNVNVNESGEQIVLPKVSVVPSQPITRPAPPAVDPVVEQRRQQAAQRMRNVADEIRRVLSPLTGSGQVKVTEGAFGVSVEINASLLFAPGEAALGSNAVSALQAVARVLAPAEFPITVEGHTDNVPISTFRFPSNWELSAVRASTVARLFIDNGVTPARLTAAGYADQRPVADNADEEGRGRNRRVTILIESRMADPEGNAGPTTIPPDDPIRSILPEAPQG
ncbi:MAG TPA: flagellar motor protein MotD [Thauera aminoaromatica]|jgi:chemotaxis protein MotB|uniref:Flagellar motor protein MotD n=1 Tax=Thauera aminoaromatica TaxID=164330 RepID=A0A5C7SRL9_THASP|nr:MULTISPECIES: flagellar motor protein MotD [Thauera]OPZ06336.1 MAG: Motility protein B [Alphaproteobacteria bacterium ADurb.BinA305]MBP6130342.1 flagellar motor protein MotD [Thauera sp.]MBP7048132.1 flagellar motor protein MotD [Thauera sp.]MBX3681337.1 flagellar motor protein MotD [Thauera sp.]MCK6399057.1 flagellar motor protein MotD [Thauera aminoaromatica]